jgi:hypothetical protein
MQVSDSVTAINTGTPRYPAMERTVQRPAEPQETTANLNTPSENRTLATKSSTGASTLMRQMGVVASAVLAQMGSVRTHAGLQLG